MTTPPWVERDRALRADLAFDRVRDPEAPIFRLFLAQLPPQLTLTPLLCGVSWDRGRYDLLFTDESGARVCAVEMKPAPEIYGTGRARRHRKDKLKDRWEHLLDQTYGAVARARTLFPAAQEVHGLALWLEDRWRVLLHV